MSDAEDEPPAPHWGVVGNVVEERLVGASGEVRAGTKKLRPGAKVHFHSAFWGMGGEQITVVGRHRGSNRFVTTVLDHRHVTNWRAKVIYEPAVLRRLADGELLRRFAREDHPAEDVALELAGRLQAHRDSTMRAVDRPAEEIDRLIDRWAITDDPDLRWVRVFDGDRAMLLLRGGDEVVGVGKTTADGGRALWVRPGASDIGLENGLSILTNRAKELPTIELSPAKAFAYRTGLAEERYEHIGHRLELAETVTAKLVAAAGSDGAERPELLAEFVVEVVLPLPELDWPMQQAASLVGEWLQGAEIDRTHWVVRRAIRALTVNGAGVTKAALVALTLRGGHDPRLANKLASMLGVRRLGTGTPSTLAHDAVGRTYPGMQPVTRAEAVRHWLDYRRQNSSPSAAGFSDYLREAIG